VGALALRMGRGCAELHDRMMVGLRVNRCELDELWSYVGKKQRNATKRDLAVTGDQYTFVALAASTRATIAYRTGTYSNKPDRIAANRCLMIRGSEIHFHSRRTPSRGSRLA